MMMLPSLVRWAALLATTGTAVAWPASSELVARQASANKGAVASESDICSKIGADIIENGGNAVDALVGTNICIGVVGMYHSGIGGGGFMLVRAPNGTYEFIDFRETAPAAAFQDMYNNDTDLSIFGGLASGVPGELRGLQSLHQRYGSMTWKQVLTPAILVARDGWNVTKDLVSYMKSGSASARDPGFLCADPAWAVDFCPNGTRLGLGDVITRKRYAATLETIANHGADAFYSGAIANATIAALQAQNGTMTLGDLANYTVAIRPVNNITYRDYTIYGTSAPSSGSIVLSTLNTLSGYSDYFSSQTLNISTHRLDEAMRFAYGARTDFGDPSFVANMTRYEQQLLLPSTGTELRSRISDTQTFNVSYYDPAGIQSLETPGTSAIVVADASGMAISLTTTINLLFGSNLIVPETGVIMNNEMNDFSIPGSSNAFGYIPSPNNYIRPGKRPLSSISPVIAEFTANGTLYFLTSCAGGSRIITANIQNTVNVLDRNLSSLQALYQPRLHDQLVPNQVTFEYAYNNQTVNYMRGLGVNVTWVAPGQSSAQAIRLLPNGTFDAASEPRLSNSGGYAV